MVPKNLTQEEKDNGKNIDSDMSEKLDLLASLTTSDETWIFRYNPEIKH